MWTRAVRLSVRFCCEESGQDLIEYGILTGIVVAIGVVIFTTIHGRMGAAYINWGASAQNNWVPDPSGK
jgi:Flp pilus assembly pilin Flp